MQIVKSSFVVQAYRVNPIVIMTVIDNAIIIRSTNIMNNLILPFEYYNAIEQQTTETTYPSHRVKKPNKI